jgi:16S rRNA processing protein RimM
MPTGGSDRRVVALVRAIHGLRGVVRVEILTDRPDDRFAPGRRLFVEGSGTPLTIASGEPVPDGPGWRLRFRGLDTRAAVEPLRDAYLEADVGEQPPAHDDPAEGSAGAVWWDEVVGVPVSGPDGEALGTVRDVYRAGASEVYSVEGGTRGPFELPSVRDYILEFAPREGRIVVDPSALDLRPPGATRRPRGRRTVRAFRSGGPAPGDDGGAP